MKYEYWFANIKGIGNQKKKRIRKRLVSAQELYYIEETGLQALGVEEKDAQIIRKSIETWDLEEEYERMQQKKILHLRHNLRHFSRYLIITQHL